MIEQSFIQGYELGQISSALTFDE